MENLENLANEIKGNFEAKAKEVESKVDSVKSAVEALEEKSKEVETLKSQITNIVDRADTLEAKLAKQKEEAKKEVKSFGQSLTDAIAEFGGGDLNKGFLEAEKMLKAANGSFTINMNTKVVGDMSTSGSLTGDPMRSYNSRQGLVPAQAVNMRDLIPTVVSPTGTFVTYRETGSEGSISAQTEGSSKSQIDYDFTEIVTVNKYIAGFARFSKQLMKNLPFLEGTLSRMLLRDFFKAENASFFTTVSGAATGSGTVTSTTSDIEAIIELVGNQLAANFNPSYALVNPKQMARLQRETFTNGYYAGAGAVALTANGINIAGMPVLPASWVTDNYILIIDRDYLERIEVEGLNVTFSYDDATNFTSNKVTARVEAYEEVNTLRVDSIIYKDLTAIS